MVLFMGRFLSLEVCNSFYTLYTNKSSKGYKESVPPIISRKRHCYTPKEKYEKRYAKCHERDRRLTTFASIADIKAQYRGLEVFGYDTLLS